MVSTLHSKALHGKALRGLASYARAGKHTAFHSWHNFVRFRLGLLIKSFSSTLFI